MEYASKGDLLEYVKKRGNLREDEAGVFFAQICEGVDYLHGRSVCHRDLKCENVLLRKDLTVALTDFGFARTLPDRNTLSSTYCGSAAYASPELLRGRPYDPMLNDVWSLGCVLFIMVTGHMPFYEKNNKKMLYKQLKGKVRYPDHPQVSKPCQNLIGQMLEPNTSLRSSSRQLLRHKWMESFRSRVSISQGSAVDAVPTTSRHVENDLHDADIFGNSTTPQTKCPEKLNISGSNVPSGSKVEHELSSTKVNSIATVDLVESLCRTTGTVCILPQKVCTRADATNDASNESVAGGKEQSSSSSVSTYASATNCRMLQHISTDPTNSKALTNKQTIPTKNVTLNVDKNFKQTIKKILQVPTITSQRKSQSNSVSPANPSTSTDVPKPDELSNRSKMPLDGRQNPQKSQNQCSLLPDNGVPFNMEKKKDEDENSQDRSKRLSPRIDSRASYSATINIDHGSRSGSAHPSNAHSRLDGSHVGPDQNCVTVGQTRIRQEGLVSQIRRIFESKDAATGTSPSRKGRS